MLVTFKNEQLESFEKELLALFKISDEPETKIMVSLKNFYKEAIETCESNNILFINRYYSQIINDFHNSKLNNIDYSKLLIRIFIFAIYKQSSSFPNLVNTKNPVSPYLDYQVKFVKQADVPTYLTEFAKRFYGEAV